jgi:hypothetical protein
MNAILPKAGKILLPALILMLAGFHLSAQLNCDGVTQMYAMFKQQAGTNGNSYISPISYTTGLAGTMMPPGVFAVPRASSTTGGTAYGSTSLAADMVNNRFFYMTADYGAKDLWAGDAITGVQTKIADNFPTSLNGYYFVKAAVSPNGFVYSMSTDRGISSSPDTKLIRWNSCATANCANIQVMAVIPNAQFDANILYNGDLAFAANGDMYIFGSEVDPATGTYVKASAFRIAAADIPSVPGTGSLTITRIGEVPSLDNTVISGFAFDGAGNYYLATIDQATRRVSSIYKGSGFGPLMTPVLLSSVTYTGYLISDLATCVYPMLTVLSPEALRLKGSYLGGDVSLSWITEGHETATDFVVERKAGNAAEFIPVGTVQNDATIDRYQYTDKLTGISASEVLYRIAIRKQDGSVRYSNILPVQKTENRKTTVLLLENPVSATLKLEITTTKPGVRNLLVYDNNGMVVISEKTTVTSGINRIMIDKAGRLKSGMYILHLFDENDSEKVKLIKR